MFLLITGDIIHLLGYTQIDHKLYNYHNAECWHICNIHKNLDTKLFVHFMHVLLFFCSLLKICSLKFSEPQNE